MWCCKWIQKIRWTDRVRNQAVLQRVKQERNILHTVTRMKGNWIGHILRRNCLLKHTIEGNTVDPRKSNGLILEQLETRTKNSRKILFETRIKIRKSNHELGIAQHRAAHAHLTLKSNKLKVKPPLGTDCV
jgi:hypothetical protein